jgi:hypothetical protein
LALLIAASPARRLLLRVELTGAGIAVARVAGIAMIAFGVPATGRDVDLDHVAAVYLGYLSIAELREHAFSTSAHFN